MGGMRGKAIVAVLLTASSIFLAACGSSGGAKAAAPPAGTPTVIIPKTVEGSSGQGPVYGSNAAGPVALPDRSIAVSSFTLRYQKSNKAEFVDLGVTVTNSGQAPINNQPKFFELIGQGGDVFSYQDNSSDTFYGPIDPHSSRTGLIEFEIPAAAAKGLQLLYHPDAAIGVAIIRLNPS